MNLHIAVFLSNSKTYYTEVQSESNGGKQEKLFLPRTLKWGHISIYYSTLSGETNFLTHFRKKTDIQAIFIRKWTPSFHADQFPANK